MKKCMILPSISTFITILFLIYFLPTLALRAEVENVTISGNKRISTETIKVISGLSTGNQLTSDSINSALVRLNRSGLFSDVKIEKKENAISIIVIENVIISEVLFEGNKFISNDDLIEIVESSPRNAFSRELVFSDVKRLIELYKEKGRFEAVVKPEFIETQDGKVSLIFTINEGELLEVGDIIFVGNNAFTDKKLSSITPSKKKGLLSFITDSDNYSDTMLSEDRFALERFYKDNGFIDFQVKSSFGIISTTEVSEIILSYTIFEGPQYRIGGISIDAASLDLNEKALRELFDIKKGDIYKGQEINKAIKSVEKKLIDSGMPLAKVSLIGEKNDSLGVIDLNIVFQNDRKLFVERIDIRGNTQTLDRVIRREFDIVEGDAFNPLMLQKTEERLKALGFFEKVSIRINTGSSSEKVNVIVDVVESPTGSLNFGVGYSTDTKITGSLSLSEKNLLGKGQKLTLNLSVSESSQSLNFGFTEPAFLGRDLSAGIGLKFQQADPSESTYTSNSTSISPNFGFKTGPNSRMQISYELENLEINSKNSLSAVLRNDDGQYTNSSINSAYVYDKRNSIVEPTNGYILRLTNGLSGLGGSIGLLKNSIRGKVYRSILDDAVVFSAELEAGILTNFKGYSRVTDRFKLGGRNFRGFQFGEIGPRDVTGEALGGERYIMNRLEANFPLGLPKELGLYGGAFAEMGSLWSLNAHEDVTDAIMYSEKKNRSSGGLSLYWSTPIGPLQFNWSRPIEYIEGVDVTEKFSLNLATRF